MKVAAYIAGGVVFLLLVVWLSGWVTDHQKYVCTSQGGTPVIWNNQVQCVFPGGVPLR